ncbi:MAG: serine/threonine protein kinase, partial [Planctomycetales bacterium]|nr:serine/threonine protein kinase [Planctomycetales bacterium]
VADALAYAHREGVLHRDVKPSNLLLDRQRSVWVSDFGLAQTVDSDRLTQTGDVVGTLRYMAPERLDGWSEPRSDIYALGATLYELLTLTSFFQVSQREQLLERIVYAEPPLPRKINRQIPRDLETVVLKAIAKEPAHRYRTADELADDLRRFSTGMPVLARRASTLRSAARWSRRNPLAAVLAAGFAAALLALFGVLAVTNAQIRAAAIEREAALREKTAALDTARQAVDDMLTRTASEVFADTPRLHPIRVGLLNDALGLYERLAASPESDPSLLQQLVKTLHAKANLERELDDIPASLSSLRRGVELQRSIIAAHASRPNDAELLALLEQDVAMTLFYQSEHEGEFRTESEVEYKRVLEAYDDLERDFPGRLEPVVHCLRHLGVFARHRGQLEQAKTLWRQALRRGAAYVARHPEDYNERHELAWASTNLYDVLAAGPDADLQEAEQALLAALGPLAEQLQSQPGAIQAIDAACAVRIRLGGCLCRRKAYDEGVSEFRRAIGDMQDLCRDYPWNEYYWGNLPWFHEEMSAALVAAERSATCNELLRSHLDWL